MKQTHAIFVDGRYWGLGSDSDVKTLRKQGFTCKMSQQAGTTLLRVSASSKKAERDFIKSFTENKHGELQ